MNLLNVAAQMIDFATVNYFQFVSRIPNVVGQLVATFAEPVLIKGSLQAVPRNMYEAHGLDLNKKYALFYVSKSVVEVQRDVTGDQFTYNGEKFQVESTTDWFGQDGWKGLIASYFTNA